MSKKVIRVVNGEGKVRIGPNVKDEGWGKGKPKLPTKPTQVILRKVTTYP